MQPRCWTARVALILSVATSAAAQTAVPANWVGTWAASPVQVESGFGMRAFSDTTLREIAHVSVGGSRIRIRFTNEFGLDPLTIGDAHAALSAGGSRIKDGTDHVVTFGGAATVRIPPGATVFSDAVEMQVTPLADIAVSFHIPAQVMRSETVHSLALQDNFVGPGNMGGAPDLAQPATLTSWYFIDGIDVPAAGDSRAIIAFGDSITDGAHSTPNSNRRWPDLLAARLQKDSKLAQVAVLNEGISGNRVLNEVAGPSALSRFNRDVLAQNNVKYVIVLESINDIGHTKTLQTPYDDVTAEQIEFGLRQLADAAHQHGLKAFGATLTPFKGAPYYTEHGEQMRQAVNQWIRSSGAFDAVIDFDEVTRDRQDPLVFNPQYDCGDHLHPNDAGYAAMAAAVDLNLLAK